MPKLPRSANWKPEPVENKQVSSAPPNDWRIQTLEEFLSEVDVKRRWAVKEFLPYGSLTLVTGPQKRGKKTWWADTTALCVSTGSSRWGFEVEEPMPVLYCQEEGTSEGTKLRMGALRRDLGLSDTPLTNIHFSFRQRVKLDEQTWRTKLLKQANDIGPALVIFDAVTYMHSADENKTNEMRPVVETIQTLRAAGHTVMFLAHLSGSNGEDPKCDIDRQIRGAGLFANVYDTHIAHRCYKEGKPIDLTVRSRERGQRLFTVNWTIIEGPNDSIAKVHLSIVDKEAKASPEKEARLKKHRVAMLEVGVPYSVKDLAKLWGLVEKETRTFAAALIEEGTLLAQRSNWIRIGDVQIENREAVSEEAGAEAEEED